MKIITKEFEELLNENPQKLIEYCESIKPETLRVLGFPENKLWLTECQSLKDFAMFAGTELFLDLDFPERTIGVVYYGESGEVHQHAGFHDLQSFYDACRNLVNLMFGEYKTSS